MFAIYKPENIVKGYFRRVEVLKHWVCKASIGQVISQVINLEQNVIELESNTEIAIDMSQNCWTLSYIPVRHGMCELFPEQKSMPHLSFVFMWGFF